MPRGLGPIGLNEQQHRLFSPFSFRVCERGGFSYCQCQLDFMPSFLSIWADSSLYETIILPPTFCVFSAIGGKGRVPFYSCHPFLLVKVRAREDTEAPNLTIFHLEWCKDVLEILHVHLHLYLDVYMHSKRPLIDPLHAVVHVCAFDGPVLAFCFYAQFPVASLGQ